MNKIELNAAIPQTQTGVFVHDLLFEMNSPPAQYVSAEPAAVLVFGADVLEGSGRAEGRPPHLPLQPAATDRG